MTGSRLLILCQGGARLRRAQSAGGAGASAASLHPDYAVRHFPNFTKVGQDSVEPYLPTQPARVQ
jgi:hypothetical protein